MEVISKVYIDRILNGQYSESVSGALKRIREVLKNDHILEDEIKWDKRIKELRTI